MGKLIDLTGQRFGRLLVVRKDESNNNRRRPKWVCLCDCGGQVIVSAGSLRSGNTKSCGCFRRDYVKSTFTTHGRSKGVNRSKEYSRWLSMRSRCNNPNNKQYMDYGGRGITVCERWNNFENFLADMGVAPENKTLDRIDNNKGYSPDNCRWADIKEQSNNKRRTRMVEYNGNTISLSELSQVTGHSRDVLKRRIYQSGWSVQKAAETPVKHKSI